MWASAVGRVSTEDNDRETEFVCEVVRITEILPHGNADKLEVAKFELAKSGPASYEVIVQKDTVKVGQTMTYLSVDCIVPTSRPEFAFLLARLDGAGKDFYKLKAARLRGRFSQGLLVEAPPGLVFGEQATNYHGVTYYVPPEPVMGGGPTAPSGKKRSQPWPQYGVDSLKKCANLFELGEEVVVTEKIHGTNFRFGWVRRKVLGIPFGWRFRVGSHRAMKDDVAGGGYYAENLWAQYAKTEKLKEKTKDYKGYLFVGELFGTTYSGQKIQDLTYGYKASPELAIFDIRHKGAWLNPFERTTVCTDVGLFEVPVIERGPYCPTMLGHAEGKSVIDQSQIREGVVIESVGQRKKAKYVGQGYLLRKEAA